HMLGPGDGAAKLPLEQLRKLEKRGDTFGLAAAYLVRGQPSLADNALAELGTLGEGPDFDSERAYAHLVRGSGDQGEMEDALRFAERALAASPRHGPALWNKALALHGLGLTLYAARTFGEIAQAGEPGWAQEAQLRADQHQKHADQEWKQWKAANEAGEAWVTSGTLPDRAFWPRPVLRRYFYDAVRTRTSAAEVDALLPMARELDSATGGTALQRYVERTAKRDFNQRSSAARQYLQLVQHPADANDPARIARLTASGEDDIAIGALDLVLQGTAGDAEKKQALRAFEDRAHALGDPWFDALALTHRARALRDAGDLPGARAALEQALKASREARLDYRYLDVAIELTNVQLAQSDLEAAHSTATEAWKVASRAGNWSRELQLVQDLSQVAKLRNHPVLARAFLEEAQERAQKAPPQ
ncbi:MAG TPA: hypothetical protein VND93_00595, partial [Myxococcales bacterium]|nr:hypothetical protein [Myxococcales bacterium]